MKMGLPSWRHGRRRDAPLSLGDPKQVLLDIGAWAWLTQGERLARMDLPAPIPSRETTALSCDTGSPHAQRPVQPQLPSPDSSQPWEPPALAPAPTLQRCCLETKSCTGCQHLGFLPCPGCALLQGACPACPPGAAGHPHGQRGHACRRQLHGHSGFTAA